VALFWRQPDEALATVRSLLEPGGVLYLFNQAPGLSDAASARLRWSA
jgi:hypothetical protein